MFAYKVKVVARLSIALVVAAIALGGCSSRPDKKQQKGTLQIESMANGNIKFVYTQPFNEPLDSSANKRQIAYQRDQQKKGGQYRSLLPAAESLDPRLVGITDPEMEKQAELGLDAALDQQEICMESLTIEYRRWTLAGYQLAGHCQ